MIKTPPEIYDKLYKVLSENMVFHRELGEWKEAEETVRVIEFLEKHLEKDTDPQPPPVWVVGNPDDGGDLMQAGTH